MLFLNNKNRYSKEQLNYYNLIEKKQITIENLKDINLIYYYEFQKVIVSPETTISIKILKELCKIYLNIMCNYYIEKGIDVILSDNKTYHFSLTIEDQQNLTNAFNIATFKNSDVPYHADGQECRIFSKDDIKLIYETYIMHITQQTTYCNMLKQYSENCKTKEEVINIYYSMDLPEEYQEKYNKIISYSLGIINV